MSGSEAAVELLSAVVSEADNEAAVELLSRVDGEAVNSPR